MSFTSVPAKRIHSMNFKNADGLANSSEDESSKRLNQHLTEELLGNIEHKSSIIHQSDQIEQTSSIHANSEAPSSTGKDETEKLADKRIRDPDKQTEKKRKLMETQEAKKRKEAEKIAQREKRKAEKKAEKEKREAEKQAEKERLEAEKLKAQPRINSFFKLQPSQSQQTSAPSLNSYLSELSSSPGPQDIDMEDQTYDYDIHILPFQSKIGGEIFSSVCNVPLSSVEANMNSMEWLRFQHEKYRNVQRPSQKLTSQLFQKKLAMASESSQIEDLLTRIRIRRLQFSHLSNKYLEDATVPINEELRPPFIGMTRDIPDRKLLALDPLRVDLDSSLNYEYDSELEWENEDGEDLRDDDGEDSDEEASDQEELREFLSSDEDDTGVSKPKLIGPLKPIVIWGHVEELANYAMEMLSNLNCIDPTEEPPVTSAVQPPVLKESLDFNGIIDPICKKIGFSDLKSALVTHIGSTSTKILIVELLKQQFSMVTAQEIRQLFDLCMERVGKKRNEKRWLLTSEAEIFFNLKP